MFKIDFVNKKVYEFKNSNNGACRCYTYKLIDDKYIVKYGKKIDIGELYGENTIMLGLQKYKLH